MHRESVRFSLKMTQLGTQRDDQGEVTRTSHTNPLRVTFSVGGLAVRRGDALAEFADRSAMEFSGDHSAQRHMHLEIRGGPLAILPRLGRNPDFLLFQNVRLVSTLM